MGNPELIGFTTETSMYISVISNPVNSALARAENAIPVGCEQIHPGLHFFQKIIYYPYLNIWNILDYLPYFNIFFLCPNLDKAESNRPRAKTLTKTKMYYSAHNGYMTNRSQTNFYTFGTYRDA